MSQQDRKGFIPEIRKPASLRKSGCRVARLSGQPSGRSTFGCPSLPSLRTLLRTVPLTGTEMEACPFGFNPATGTGTITSRTLHKGGNLLILATSPFSIGMAPNILRSMSKEATAHRHHLPRNATGFCSLFARLKFTCYLTCRISKRTLYGLQISDTGTVDAHASYWQ
jgi:hypothetical protein